MQTISFKFITKDIFIEFRPEYFISDVINFLPLRQPSSFIYLCDWLIQISHYSKFLMYRI